MSLHPLRLSRRTLVAAGALAVALVAGSLGSGHALAGFTVCEGDPIISLSNGAQVQVQTTVGDVSSDVQSIVYTVHVPQGLTVNQIVYPAGDLANKEAVQVLADQSSNSYVTDTVVTTATNSTWTYAQTTVSTASSSMQRTAYGLTGQDLNAHLWLSL